MPMNPRLLRPLASGFLKDADAIAYVAAVEAADGQKLEKGVALAYESFITGCKSDGIWDAIKASCILAGARTLAGALVPLKFGEEQWDAPTPSITALQGASGSWDAATLTMNSLTTGTSGTTPRFAFDLGLVAGRKYIVSGRLSGDTSLVGSVRLGTSLLTYNGATGEISGSIPAVDANLVVYFNSTLGPASATIESLSVKEDWTPTNNNFVSGDYDRKTGLVGNGTSKFLNTNRNANADPQDNFHLAFYLSVSFSASNLAAGAGAISTGATQIHNNEFRCRNGTANSPTVAMGTVSLHGMSRSNSADFVGRCGGTSQTFTRDSQTPVNANLLTHARLSGGTAGLFSGMRISFYSIGEAVNLATLESRVSALSTAIGAAIP